MWQRCRMAMLDSMQRVPAHLALRLLHDSGYTITAGALRQWVYRGHITRGKGGYDLAEIVAYLDARERAAASSTR